jgi:hypothetical protein
LSVETAASFAVSTETSYKRMLVPPTSPSSTWCNFPYDIDIFFINYYQSLINKGKNK